MKRDDAIKYLTEKLGPDEDVFVLRAQDKFACELVMEWSRLADAFGTPAAKVQEAKQCAGRMHAWPNRKVPD